MPRQRAAPCDRAVPRWQRGDDEWFAGLRSAACFTADAPTLLVLGPRQTVAVARPPFLRCDWSAVLQMRKRDDHLRAECSQLQPARRLR